MWDLIVSVPDDCLSFFTEHVLIYRYTIFEFLISSFCRMHYCTVTLPVHLFLTMKSPEHAQI